ncbi:MAG: arylesterase [Gammaproteobacteria bacterium]
MSLAGASSAPARTEVVPVSPTILIFGDSLSASYGIAQKAGWVNLLQQRLAAQGYAHKVVNASISGETTSGGLTRIQRVLDTYNPNYIIIELGGNDGLRGLPLHKIRSNLTTMIEKSREHGAQVLLAGMRLPPNYGPAYTKKFHDIYLSLAQQYKVAVLPFFLEGIAQKTELMQADGIHPRSVAQTLVLDNVWEVLEPLLDRQLVPSNKFVKSIPVYSLLLDGGGLG